MSRVKFRMNKTNAANQSGFTLIELMVVVAHAINRNSLDPLLDGPVTLF